MKVVNSVTADSGQKMMKYLQYSSYYNKRPINFEHFLMHLKEFVRADDFITKFNAGHHTSKMAHNYISDLTADEIK